MKKPFNWIVLCANTGNFRMHPFSVVVRSVHLDYRMASALELIRQRYVAKEKAMAIGSLRECVVSLFCQRQTPKQEPPELYESISIYGCY